MHLLAALLLAQSSAWCRQDAEFLLKLDPPIEYICVSFVQKDQDLQELIDIMDRLQIPQDYAHGRASYSLEA